MNLINMDYISIEWMYKWLIDKLYQRKIGHEIMKLFYRMVSDWRRENEDRAGSSV